MKFGPTDILFLLAMIAVMYFLFFLPQKKKQQETAKMHGGLKKGDRVLTHSGMYGEIAAIKDNIITLKFQGETRIDFDKSAISRSLENLPEEKAAKA